MKRKLYARELTETNEPGKAVPFLKRIMLALALVFTSHSLFAQAGEALHFDGTNDRVDIPVVVTGSYTKELWIRPDVAALSAFPNLLSGAQTAIFLNNGNLSAGHAPGFNQVLDPSGALPAGVWTHVAVTYDSVTNLMTLFKNGVQVAQNLAPAHAETFLRIGTFSNSNFFTGGIDEVRIWDYARSGADILATLNCALQGDEPNLLAYYNFDHGVAGADNTGITTLSDMQDECIPDNGTLVNFTLNGATSNWISPGASITFTCPGFYENINVTGNLNCFESGDMSPSLVDHTNFGDFGINPLIRTFTIENTGTDTLFITNVTITGPDASDFAITGAAADTVLAGSSTTLEITFTGSGTIDPKNAVVTIENSDEDEGEFVFAITGYNRGPGEALHFDGLNDSIQLPFVLSGSYTKEVWINTAQLTAFPNLISDDATAMFLNNGRIAAGHAPTFTQLLDPTPVVANTWYHMAVTYDAGTGDMVLYKDGVVVASATGVGPYTATKNLALGTFQNGNFYNGLMDEVRIWNTVRTQAEIIASMNCELSGDEPDLQAYYKFNQGAASGANPGDTLLIDSDEKCVPLNGRLFNFALNTANSNFIEPGAPVSGICAGTFPNIALSSGGACIDVCDTTPSFTDSTDFGIYTNTPIVRTFTITNTGSSDLTLTGTPTILITGPDAAMFTVIDNPDVVIGASASTNFTIQFVAASLGIKTAVVTILSDDGDEASYCFTIQGEGSSIVPVTLLTFDGSLQGSSVKLNWKTGAEANFRGFEVYRSNAAQESWENIGFVEASGNAGGSTYSLVDFAPMNGVNTYRLRQVDLDGTARFSNIVAVNNTNRNTVVTTYPNPFQSGVQIVFNDSKLLNTIATVRNITGAKVAEVRLTNYRQQVNLSNLAKGMYVINFTNGEVIRVLKQ